jgi:hypothetical protein
MAPTRGDKVGKPHGVAVTDGRRRLCHERGHHMVTSCTTAGMGLGNQIAWLSCFGLRPVGQPEFKICPIFKIISNLNFKSSSFLRSKNT